MNLLTFKTMFGANIFCTMVVSIRKTAQRIFRTIGKLIMLRLKVNIYVLFLKQNIKCSISLEPYFREEYNGCQFKTIRRKKQEITALVNVLRVNMAERKCAMLRKSLSLKMVKKQLKIT